MQIERRKIFLLIILALVLALIWLRPLDAMALQYSKDGLARALATLTVAQGMNAAISLFQSVSLDVQVFVGVGFHPGVVLNPLVDLLEQFSTLMLAATFSFATQRLLIEVASASSVCWLLTFLVVACGVIRWQNWTQPSWLSNLTVGLLCLRLVVPAVAIVSEATYVSLLASKYNTSQKEIKTADDEIQGVNPNDANDAKTQATKGLSYLVDKFVQKVESMKKKAGQATEVAQEIKSLKKKVDGVVEHLVRLAAVFIVQTIVLPLLFLWLMLRLYHVLSTLLLYPRKSNDRKEQHVPQLQDKT
jgi:hypothetical protein